VNKEFQVFRAARALRGRLVNKANKEQPVLMGNPAPVEYAATAVRMAGMARMARRARAGIKDHEDL
tara:strand:- start:726 stop:923 length:198 start_codon:yes stop_codon:yes gene_type:complete